MSKEKVLLVGNFGARNVGDELILWTALQEYPEAVVMTADRGFSLRFLTTFKRELRGRDKKINPQFIPPFPTGFRSFLKFIFNRKFREKILSPLLKGKRQDKERKIKKIIFAGGGLLAIKIKAYFIWSLTKFWLKRYFPEAEIICEHQGVDQTNYWLKKEIVKYFFKDMSKISVRDEISHNFLLSLNIKSEIKDDRVENWLKKNHISIENKKINQKNIILFNACRANSTKFSELIKNKQFQKNGLSFIFICLEPQDARYVPDGFKGKIVFPENIEETFKIFQKTKIAIGQRLHFVILANHFCGSLNTFTLGTPYSQKVENFAKKYNIKKHNLTL